ncbi:hypothetical protein [Aquimarina sp. AU119]|uniref:hypothetical protein n=1 Tax=Aquimarina sp. AU119 TaxID=2108528 RepID=UPI00190EC49A|nr:hypothetical protein [Aquimarina sp. AU119]
MKALVYFIIFLILSAKTLTAQSFNREVNIEENSPMLLGKISNHGLNQNPYNHWFSKNYTAYTPNQNSIDSLKTELQQYTIKLFMGTWCGDSKREVPRFYKILENSNFPLDRLTTIAVDRSREAYKQSPGGEHEGLNIHRVPTFIFYKDGKEINRIVESPIDTLEEDMLAIVSGNYISKYKSVLLLNDILEKKGALYISKNGKKIAKQFKDNVENLYELNTYANVLFFANKKNEAITILSINTILFPKESYVYVSLANKHVQMKNKASAIKYYEKSLEFDNNEEIQNKIKELRTTVNQG